VKSLFLHSVSRLVFKWCFDHLGLAANPLGRAQ
jgi:hypothetical protein